MGRLQEMIDKQAELQKRLGVEMHVLTAKQRTEMIKEFSIHVNQEMNEMLYELPYFKPWKDYEGMTDKEIETAFYNAQKEFIDFMHFNLNIAILLGFNEDMMHAAYMDKNKENHSRQDDGYTHDKEYR